MIDDGLLDKVQSKNFTQNGIRRKWITSFECFSSWTWTRFISRTKMNHHLSNWFDLTNYSDLDNVMRYSLRFNKTRTDDKENRFQDCHRKIHKYVKQILPEPGNLCGGCRAKPSRGIPGTRCTFWFGDMEVSNGHVYVHEECLGKLSPLESNCSAIQ